MQANKFAVIISLGIFLIIIDLIRRDRMTFKYSLFWLSSSIFDAELERRKEQYERHASMSGEENPWVLHREMGEMMLDHVTVERHNDRLEEVDGKLDELSARWEKIGLADDAKAMKQSVQFTRHLELMLLLARVIVRGALARNESRGAHFKPAFPDRNDEEWLNTTIAEHDPQGPRLSYEPVDIGQSTPRKRSYATKGAAAGLASPEVK